MAEDMQYLTTVPQLPPTDGNVIVHNHVRPEGFTATWGPGWAGWRAWLSKPGPDLIECDCGWAPQAGDHYRKRGVGYPGRNDG